MGRYSWLGFVPKSLSHVRRFNRPLPSSISTNGFLYDLGDRYGGLSPLLRTLLYSRTLYSCSCDVTRGRAKFLATGIPIQKQFFHATGLRYSSARDFYEILGVSKDASRDDIKKAFHALAKKYHPDANKNNPAAKRKFQEIRDAYETLRDSEKRAQYDKERIGGPAQGEYAVRNAEDFKGAYEAHFSDSFHKIFSEIFEDETEDFASDIQVELVLSFSEAAKGCQKHLTFNSHVLCDSCNGRGHPTDAKPKICPTCKGIGRVTVPPFTSTCSTCKGLGRIIKENCTECRGVGVVEGVKEVNVTIPAGIESGDTIRVPKAGNSGGRRVQPGSLYIKLKVAKDPIFHRDGADIYVESHISFTQAALERPVLKPQENKVMSKYLCHILPQTQNTSQAILGGKVNVPTLSGEVEVKIPKGVQPGHLVVLRGRGLPKQGGFFRDVGDQYVRFRVNFPNSLSECQRALIEEFAEEECNNANSASDGGNWWKLIVDRFTDPYFVLEIGFFLLILLLLTKAVG